MSDNALLFWFCIPWCLTLAIIQKDRLLTQSWLNDVYLLTAPCGYNVTAPNGTIFSPEYPNEYPDSQDCTWLITVPHGNGVYINFTLLQTEPVTDYIAVWWAQLLLQSRLANISLRWGQDNYLSFQTRLMLLLLSYIKQIITQIELQFVYWHV